MGHQREMEGQGLPTVWATPMVRAFMFWAAWGNVTFAHMLTTQADGLGGHGTPEGNGGAGPANRVGNTEGEGFCVMGCLGKCCFCALLQQLVWLLHIIQSVPFMRIPAWYVWIAHFLF
jgi:hypothetical protein